MPCKLLFSSVLTVLEQAKQLLCTSCKKRSGDGQKAMSILLFTLETKVCVLMDRQRYAFRGGGEMQVDVGLSCDVLACLML